MPRSLGIPIIIAGAAILLVGILVVTGSLSWFGHLPGDIRIENPGSRIYIPIVSCLILSIGFSLVAYLIRRWVG